MMDGFFKSGSETRLVERYQRLRQVGWKLNNEVLPKYLPRPALEICAKKLGLWRRGTAADKRPAIWRRLSFVCA
jgi:hypothetical protein